MTGMIVGCGVTAAVSAVLAATGPGYWGILEGGAVAAVLLLRGRTYANGAQAVALLLTGMLTAGGLLAGWLVEATALTGWCWCSARSSWWAPARCDRHRVPEQRFSPVLRRSVTCWRRC